MRTAPDPAPDAVTGAVTGRATGFALQPPGRLVPLGDRVGPLPWWAAALLVWAGSRVVSSIVLLCYAAIQAPSAFASGHPDLVAVANQWDARWYQTVAQSGYPSVLPRDAQGDVTENDWAFMPLYPLLVRGLMALTGVGFDPAALLVTVVAGAASAVVLFALIRQRWSARRSLWFVAAYCLAPLAPLLQLDYAESLMMLLLFAALLALVRRRYLLSIVPTMLLAFTRPTGLAMALCLGLVLLWRIRRRREDPLPLPEAARIVVAGLAAALAGSAWPIIAGIATGVPDAYTRTELRWSSYYTGTDQLTPFSPWFVGAHWWLDFWKAPASWPLAVVLVLVLVALLAVVLVRSRMLRSLPAELRLWTAAWAVYLLAVFFPQSSTFRLLMPAFPLLALVAGASSRTLRWIGLALLVAGQVGWVWLCWYVDGYDWTPP